MCHVFRIAIFWHIMVYLGLSKLKHWTCWSISIVELLDCWDFREHTCLSVGKRCHFWSFVFDVTGFDWIIGESCLVLLFQATEIERRRRFDRCLLRAGVRAFASSILAWLSLAALAFAFFSGSDVGLTANCIDVYFYRAWFPCKVVVFTRHSITAILAHIQNWNTVLFMAKSS